MSEVSLTRSVCAGGVAAVTLMWCAGLQASVIDPELEKELDERAPHEEVSVIVKLSGKVNHRQFEAKDRQRRDTRLFRALKERAAVTQAPHKRFLRKRGARRMRELWAVNGIAVTARAEVIRELASRAGVESIRPDSILQAPAVTYGSTSPPEWNLNAVSAVDMWAQGYAGTGVVVANMDTGVDANHPDLAGKWRGGGNSWFDPHGEHATPYDFNGHGTQTMSIMVGGSAGGSAIGVAPDASWIAAKLYNDAGQASYSDVHLAFQWLLDPDGDPATMDAPDVVNASWGLAGTAGQCITEFSSDIDALKTAGIAVIFAAGNDGPAPLTSLSPGNNLTGFATGAVDPSLGIASFSARGQSACDGTIFPKMTAPGVDIKAADLSFGGQPLYAAVSGTSYAAPHAAGAMALLLNAYPSAGVGDLEAALTQSAQDLGVAGADNSYGYGLVNALAAYRNLQAMMGSPPAITSTPPLTATQGKPYSYKVTASDPDGGPLSFMLDKAPAGMIIKPGTSSYVAWIGWWPTSAQVGTHDVTVRATDPAGLSTTQSFSISVTKRLDSAPAITSSPPLVATQGLAYSYRVTGSDPDGGPLSFTLDKAPAGMIIKPGTLSTVAWIGWRPTNAQVGVNDVTVRVTDSVGLSATQSFSITVANVNDAPVAANDTTYAMIKGGTLNVAAPGVLANDSDPDVGDTLTATNYSAPSTGTLTGRADGSFSYTPPATYRGMVYFNYLARDAAGVTSKKRGYVSIAVRTNTAPLPVDDTAGTPPNTALAINVLANDSDPDTVIDPANRIDPATVYIPATGKPNQGGTVIVNADGTITYTPRLNFTGTEVFQYALKDTYTPAGYSKAAYVRVNVQ